MGRQFYVFLTPSDTVQLQHDIACTGDVVFLHSRSPTERPLVVDSLLQEESGSRWLFYFATINQMLSKVHLNRVKSQNYWTIDSLSSPVLEISLCFINDSVLRRGRLYYTTSYWRENKKVVKPIDFTDWAARVFRTIKKSLSRREDGAYIGVDAHAWLKKGSRRLENFGRSAKPNPASEE